MESTVLAAVGRAALALSFPEEVDEFDAALLRYLGGGTGQPTPPVGMGIDLLPLADHLVPVLTFLFGAAAARGTERATDALTERTKTALGKLLNRTSSPQQDAPEPLDPEQEREVYNAVVCELDGTVTPDEARKLARGIIGALRLRGDNR